MDDFIFSFQIMIVLLFLVSIIILSINAVVWLISQIPRRIGNNIAKDIAYMYGMEEGGRIVRNWIKVKDLDTKE